MRKDSGAIVQDLKEALAACALFSMHLAYFAAAVLTMFDGAPRLK